MKSSELRGLLFRVATAVVFIAAIGFLRNQSVYAEPHSGMCSEYDFHPVGCDEHHAEWGDICWEYQDCANIYDNLPPWDLCYCMSEDYCGWWPNGCG
jgi:hypothetical protein